MSKTLEFMVAQEKASFDNFTEVMAERIENGLTRSIPEFLKRQLDKGVNSPSISLPIGKFTANCQTKSDVANINVSFEPNKGFLEMLADDKKETVGMIGVDADYLDLFHDFVAFGFFDANDDKNKDRRTDKGINLTVAEMEYFLNGYACVLATIVTTERREGKTYRVEINNGFEFGAFDFDYKDDSVVVTFTPSKVFKQELKNDARATGEVA